MQPSLINALAEWQHLPAAQFSTDFAPCDEVGSPECDRILARVFQRLCKVEMSDEDRMNYLFSLVGEWRVKIARWSDWQPTVDLKDARRLLSILDDWFRQIHSAPFVRTAA